MRFPWNRRADRERDAREEAEERLAEVRRDWHRVNQAVAETRREAQLNHFTATITTIFSGQ